MPPKKKSKSKVLDLEPEYEEEEISMPPPPIVTGDGDLDDEGITRCVCGKAGERAVLGILLLLRRSSYRLTDAYSS